MTTALAWGKESLGSSTDGGDGLARVLNAEGAARIVHAAAGLGRADMVHVFLEAGSDPLARDDDGDTPLHRAVAAGNERCVWALLDHARKAGVEDALIDALNDQGETALLVGHVLLWTRPPEAAVRAGKG